MLHRETLTKSEWRQENSIRLRMSNNPPIIYFIGLVATIFTVATIMVVAFAAAVGS